MCDEDEDDCPTTCDSPVASPTTVAQRCADWEETIRRANDPGMM